MALPHVTAGEVARAAEQNALIDQVNTNTNTATTNTNTLTDHGNRLTTVEGRDLGSDAGTYFGQWTDDNALKAGVLVDSAVGVRVVDLDYPVGTPIGCSLDAGTFVPTYSGIWQLSISVQYATSQSVRALYAAAGNANRDPTTAKVGLIAGPAMDAQTTSAVTRLNAGDQLSIYAAVWQGGTSFRVWRAHGNNVTAVWLGP